MLLNLKCVVITAAAIIRSNKPLDTTILLFGKHLITMDYVVERSFVSTKPLHIKLAVYYGP